VVGGGLTDAFKLNIVAADSNATPTDNASFLLKLLEADSNNAPTDAASLKFPAGDFGDSNPAPTDARTVTLRVWLSNSAGTGVTNPANANGANDGTFAVLQTTIGGSATITMTSDIGSNIGTITFSTVLYRGWFNLTTTLLTSTVSIIAHSSSALFTDITMFTFSGLNGNVNHNTGDFTFDLFAAGVNTLAKLQSLQILHRTNDAVAGVTPAVLNVDAGATDIVAVI